MMATTRAVDEHSAWDRAWAGFLWSLKLAIVYAVLNAVLWHQGDGTGKLGRPIDAEDVIAAVILMSVALPGAAVVIALLKPWCRSFAACMLVGFLAAVPLSMTVMVQIYGPGDFGQLMLRGLRAAAISSPLVGWGLWLYAKEGEAWHWPFPSQEQ